MLLLCAGLLAGSGVPAAADGALAIGVTAAFPSGGFSVGVSAGSAGEARAQAVAMRGCRGEDRASPNFMAAAREPTEAEKRCEVVATFHDRCVGVAVNGDETTPTYAYGWAVAATSASAEAQAQARCEEMRKGEGRECVVRKPVCDGAVH